MKFNYESLIENMHDGVYFTDKDRRIIYWNKAAERITGYPASETLGSRCADNILMHVDARGKTLCKALCPLAKTIRDGKTREAEVYLHHKEGHRVPVLVRVTPLMDDRGSIIGGAELFIEVSSREANRLRIVELENLALLDTLTALSNRRHLTSELEKLLNEKVRHGLSFGILFLDIDHFKSVNDTYGHGAGDQVLRTVARTLQSASRPYDLFGRWGGEEFVGLIRNADLNTVATVGERCRNLIAQTITALPHKEIKVTVSIGGTQVQRGDTLESIVKRADKNMYTSKMNGRNRLTVI